VSDWSIIARARRVAATLTSLRMRCLTKGRRSQETAEVVAGETGLAQYGSQSAALDLAIVVGRP
jgi:hypothetical protein